MRSSGHLTEATLVQLVVRWPRLGFALASLRDRARNPRGRIRPSTSRDRVMLIGRWHPSRRWPYPQIASGPDPLSLRPPMVLATFHIGAVLALAALLERLPGEVLAMVYTVRTARPGVTRIALSGGEWHRAAATKRAIATLRSGGFVCLAADGGDTSTVTVPLFDTTISLAGGCFALARIAGAPILPVVAHWRGRKIDVVVGDPIPPGDTSEMATALARWLEGYLSENPKTLRSLTTAPYLDQPASPASSTRSWP